jgi:lipopolysaccharide export LptBFGC system permease protein LptF
VLSRFDRLIFFEVLSLTLVILAILSTVMFLFRLLSLTDYLVLTQEGLLSLLMFIIFVVPNILKLTLPLSLLAASAIVVVRMSGDRETEAWMASGVSVTRFCRAPLLLGGVFAFVAAASALFMEPYARQQWRKFKWMHARKGFESLMENRLREKTFIADLFQGGGSKIALYVDKIDEKRLNFRGVFLGIDGEEEGQGSQILTAETGALIKETAAGGYDYIFALSNGRLHQPLSEGSWNVVSFDTFKISLVNMFQKQFEIGQFDAHDLRSFYPAAYLRELRQLRVRSDWGSNQRSVRDHTYFYEQIVVPLSCLFFPLIGVCLGLQDPRRRAGLAYLGLVVVVFAFYAMIMLGQQMAVKFLTPPEVSLYFPLVALASMSALILLWRHRHPPSTSFWEFVAIDLKPWIAKVTRRKK